MMLLLYIVFYEKIFYPNSRNLRKKDCFSLIAPTGVIVINFCDTLGYSFVLECAHGHIALSSPSLLSLMTEVYDCYSKPLNSDFIGVLPEIKFLINCKLPIYKEND